MSFKDNVVMLKKGDFDNKMNLKKDGKVIVLYFANWCGHCQRLKPAYQELVKTANGVVIASVNADDNDGLLDRMKSMGQKLEYEVNGFPTIISYNNGKYFSTYSYEDTEEGRAKFRTLEDLKEYADGIGSATITYVDRR